MAKGKYDIGPVIGIDGESEYNKAIADIVATQKMLTSEVNAITSAYDKNDQSVEKLTRVSEVYTKQIDVQRKKLDAQQQMLDKCAEKYGENSIETQKWQTIVNKSTTELNKMERALADSSKEIEAQKKALSDGTAQAEKFAASMKGIGDKASAAGKALTPLSAGAAGVLAGAAALAVKTRDIRSDFSKLEANATAAGASMDNVSQNMQNLYVITGETDSNIEALSNLMQAGFKDNSLNAAVEALSGAVLKFPDTLKIESLSDSLQETISTGKATGQFSELLDRLGVNVDRFNAKMDKTPSPTKRAHMALQELAKTGLADVTKGYFEQNEALTETLKAEYDMSVATAELGEAFEPIIAEIMPPLIELFKKAAEFISGLDTNTLMLITGVLALVAVVAPLLIIIGQVCTALSTINTALTALTATSTAATAATTAAAAPIIAIIAAVAALAAVLIYIEVKTGIFSKAFKAIWEGIKKVIATVSNFFIDVFTVKIPGALKKMSDFFKKIFDGLVAIIKAPINLVIKGINFLISGINTLTSMLNSIELPSFLGGGNLFDIGQIPKLPLLANGGILSQGSAIVGEAGAELLTVSNGRAIVQPLSGGAALAGAGGTTINMTIPASDFKTVADFMRITESAQRLGRMR